MDVIAKTIADYGLTGGSLLVLGYILIMQQKNSNEHVKTLNEILLKMESRMGTQEEVMRGIADKMEGVNMITQKMVTATEYCQRNQQNHGKRQ